MNIKLVYLLLIDLCLGVIGSFNQPIHGHYAIKNVQTGLLLRVQDARKADGTPIVAYSPVNWKCVTWDFVHVGGDTYQLRNLFTSKTLQPEHGKPAEGVNLEQQPLVASQSNQEYEFVDAGKDTYRIKLKGSDLYITPVDSKGSVNSRIMLAKKSASQAQLWTIYEQDPQM
ncbi:RICIN domain-containing protein [Spirosoma sp. KNUC1025]|uniref:RICIN domain-containing protein n=1 Tax=Spirosoma sp. KNUC1025 TaxID=2894082 RepID=UPI00386F056D|nr:RICIN domain-containing protein [Spirosoma sp. KNUC1025]